jgi:Mg-chelatase subunit ChlD
MNHAIEDIGPVTEQRAFEQLGVLALDGSASMRDVSESGQTKGDEVNQAVRDLIARLKASRYRENYHLATLTYDDKVVDRLAPTSVTQLDETADFNPCVGHGGATAIGDALARAGAIADQFLNGQTSELPRSVVIVVMSDGENNRGQDPIQVSERIKADNKRIRICAAAYGRSVDEQTLRGIATEPSAFARTHSAEDLRKFFLASISQGRA